MKKLTCIFLLLLFSLFVLLPVKAQTATPPPTSASPIGATEMMLLVIFLVFILLAFLTREPFLFGIAAFVSIIFGADLGLIYINNTASWAFGIIGFALIMFGIWMIFAALQFSMNKGGRK